ncbi:hypothetical protein [Marinicella meishanensis]|uniref:hypothetical protein n=1 Tax=Marinicella meishanensis TaxID=2873263 RepID=UPI001CBD4A6C|nr:hypothetical protein [Marinicella sp. NBU2979]
MRWVFEFIHDLLAMVAYIPLLVLLAWLIYQFPFEVSAWWLSGVIIVLVYAIGLTLPYELNEMDPTNERVQRIHEKKSKQDSTDADPEA